MPSWDFEFIVTLEAPSRSKQPTLAKEPVGLGRYADCRRRHVASFTSLERTCSVLSSTTRGHLLATSTTPASGAFILNHLPPAMLPHQRCINTVEADFAQSPLQRLFAGVRAFTHSESPHPVEAYTHWDFSPLEV